MNDTIYMYDGNNRYWGSVPNSTPPTTQEYIDANNCPWTFVAPPSFTATECPVWNGTAWTVEPNYTQVELYDYTGAMVPFGTIAFGQVPADIDATDTPPPNSYSVYNPATQAWEEDPGLKYDYDLNEWATDLVGIVYNISIPMQVYTDQVAASITPTIMTPEQYVEAATYRVELNTLAPLAPIPEPPTFLLELPVRPVPS